MRILKKIHLEVSGPMKCARKNLYDEQVMIGQMHILFIDQRMFI
jgi:hypothetical protein